MTSAFDLLNPGPAEGEPPDQTPTLRSPPPPGDGIEVVTTAILAKYDLLATPVWVYDFYRERILWANRAGLAFWQAANPSELGEREFIGAELFGHRVAGYRRKLERGRIFDGVWSTTIRGHAVHALSRFVPVRIDDGRTIHALVEVTAWRASWDMASAASAPADFGLADTQSEESRLNLVLEGQNAILQLIAKGAELKATLERIAMFLARIFDPKICVVQWLDGDCLTCWHVAAPIALHEDLRRWPSAAESPAGPAGAPMTGTAPAEMAPAERTAAGLQAICHAMLLAVSWSTMIRGEGGDPLGTIALLESEPEPLDESERRVVGAMVQLARFAIENDRHKLALRSANERLLSLAAMVPGVVYQRVVKPDGDIRYTYISEGARDLFGVSPEEIIADPQALFDCHGPEYYATFRERLMAASRALMMWDVEATIITRDGQRKYTHAIARPHRQSDGSVVWNGVILDQTRIKEAEMAAANAEARARDAIIESIPQGLVLYDPADRLMTWNSRFLDLYPPLRGRICNGMPYHEVVRAELQRCLDMTDAGAARGNAATTHETRLNERLALHQQAGHVFERRLADGRWILVYEHRKADSGTVILHTDVTELKAREVALERSNRELQLFASVASHDLQEPLRKIDAFGDRLKVRYRDALGAEGQLYIDRMQHAAKRMRVLINDLLDYSRVSAKTLPFTPVDLTRLVEDVIADLESTIEASGGRIELDRLPTIDADASQLRQLMQNLISNALKFRKKDQPPLVHITAEVVRSSQDQEAGDADGGGTAVIKVADNGIGFDIRYLERIFGIFQRLHGRDEYAGTGVGLATCRKIVERHGGSITADSLPGQGATFIVSLPVHQAASG